MTFYSPTFRGDDLSLPLQNDYIDISPNSDHLQYIFSPESDPSRLYHSLHDGRQIGVPLPIDNANYDSDSSLLQLDCVLYDARRNGSPLPLNDADLADSLLASLFQEVEGKLRVREYAGRVREFENRQK